MTLVPDSHCKEYNITSHQTSLEYSRLWNLLFLCFSSPPSLRRVKTGIGGSISPGRPPLSGTLPISTCNQRTILYLVNGCGWSCSHWKNARLILSGCQQQCNRD